MMEKRLFTQEQLRAIYSKQKTQTNQVQQSRSNIRSNFLNSLSLTHFQIPQKINLGLALLAVFLTILLYGVFTRSNQQNLQVEKSTNRNNYIHLKMADGKDVELPYLSPVIIRPQIISQPKNMGKIKQQNTEQFKKYVQGLGSPSQFNYKLFLNWQNNNKLLFEAEYYRLNSKYNLDSPLPQKSICVMAPFRNLLKDGSKGSWTKFLQSVNGQNYTNYRVYMIDDFSTDRSVQVLLRQVKKYPFLNNRLYIVSNRQRIGALANRDSVTRNHCLPGQIVMDIDGDDAIVGRQVFNLFNRFYKNPDAWFVYANFISVQGDSEGSGRQINIKTGKIKKGFCQKIPQKIHVENTYRVNVNVWVTSELRSYLRDLYVKVPLSHVIQRGTGKYYTFASDRFVMYALSELAGPTHTFFYPQYVYFYYEPNFRAIEKIGCKLQNIFYCQFQSRILYPLMPLQSLQDNVKVAANYQIPKEILNYYITFQLKYMKCVEKQNQIAQYFADNSQF